MSAIYTWSTIAANNNAAPPDGFPEAMTPANVNNSLREVMASLRSWYDNPEFLQLSNAYVVTRIAVDTVQIAGVDQTVIFEVGARVMTTGGAIPQYGFVSSRAFVAGNTQIVIAVDGAAALDVATNAIFLHSARTAREAAWYAVGTVAGTLPLYEDVRALTARQRDDWKKTTADQTIIAAGVTQITKDGVDFHLEAPAAGNYRLSATFLFEEVATDATCDFYLQIHSGPLGTSADPLIYRPPIMMVGAPGRDLILAVTDLGPLALALADRISFSFDKDAGPAPAGVIVRGSGTAASRFSHALLEETY